MKAAMMIDALLCKPSFIGQLAISLFVGLMLAIGFQNLYMVVPTVACTAAITSIFNLIALDESNGWEAYRLSLPLSRTQIIQGRYASAVAIALVYTLIGLVLFALLAVVALALEGLNPFFQSLASQVAEIPWQGTAMMVVFPLCFMLLFCGLAYPLVARFGLTKGVRWLPMVLVFLPLFGGLISYTGLTGAAGEQSSAPELVISLVNWLSTPEGTTLALLILFAVSIAIFIASYFLAAKLYQKREF